jgi:hypothetical protein
MPEANQAKFQKIAEDYGVEIDVRPTAREAPALLEQGALPKPEDLKSKTINDLDVLLGARPDDLGKVGFFKPEPPPRPAGMDDAIPGSAEEKALREVWKKRVDRFTQREAEYWDNAKRMTELQRRIEAQQEKAETGMDERGTHKEHQVAIGDDGVVRAVIEKGGSLAEPPFTGDHDVFDIRNADRSPLTKEKYDDIVAKMKTAGMGVAHGAHMWWTPTTPAEFAIYEAIITRHASGAEPLIRFSPGKPPTTAAPQ